MTAPLIAIPSYHLGPGRVGNWDGAYALPESYVTALGAAGARTVLLPPSQPASVEELLAPFDGLLLAGGGGVSLRKRMTRSALTSRTFLTVWSFFLPL